MSKKTDYNFILKKLLDFNEEAYLVGGVVRDSLLKRNVIDVDITTSASTKTIKMIFKDFRCICYGEKHGTITVMYNNNNYEITTYKGNSLVSDLSKRDYSINSIAKSIDQKYIYYLNSAKDFKNKTLRMNSEINILNDPIRILRGLRFTATLNFTLEQSTFLSLLKHCNLVKEIAKERITKEVVKILTGPYFIESLKREKKIYLKLLNCLGYISSLTYDDLIEKLKHIHQDYLILNTIVILVYTYKDKLEYLSSHEKIHFISYVEYALKNFTISKKEKYHVITVLSLLYKKDLTLNDIRILVGKYQSINVNRLCRVREILEFNKAETKRIENYINLIKSNSLITTKSSINLDGYDMLRLGIKGKKINEVYELLFSKILSNEVTNNADDLINYIKKNKLNK